MRACFLVRITRVAPAPVTPVASQTLAMLGASLLLLATLATCECVYVYSSFWAPLFNPRILNYRVDSPFDPDAGIKAREQYVNNYGVRGERLIADLGNGKGPSEVSGNNKDVSDVKFYYTYPGASQDNQVKIK